MATPIEVPTHILEEVISKQISVLHEPVRKAIIDRWALEWREVIVSFIRTLWGKADWVWDDKLQMHIPSCRLCGYGPLDFEQLEMGTCTHGNGGGCYSG